MRHVGTSPGGAGGFGAEGEAFGGPGSRSGDGGAGLGLRRDGREDGAGRGARDGAATRDAEARARAFRARAEGALRRTGRGPDDAEAQDGAAALAGLFGPPSTPERREPDAKKGGQDAAPAGHRAEATQARATDDDHAPASTERADPSAGPADAGRPLLAGAPGADDARRLLAAAEPPADAIAALFAPGPTPSGAGRPETPAVADAGAPAAVERRIADIADKVERALAADLATDAGAPIALRIPLDGEAGGLSSLTVTATAQGLDVTLARAGSDAPSPELLQAAQGLAERLQRRLGRGSVRIFEGVETAGAAARPDAGWAGLSAILGRRTG